VRLTLFEIRNFRKFAEDMTINFDHKLLALVGPNEAGKSTILDALERLNGGTRFSVNDYNRLRGVTLGAHFDGWFLLRSQDHEDIDHIPGASAIRWLVHSVDHNGEVSWRLHPRPQRDMTDRSAVIKDLNELLENRWPDKLLTALANSESDNAIPDIAMVPPLVERLEEAEEELGDDDVRALRELGQALLDSHARLSTQAEIEEARRLGAALATLAESEAIRDLDEAVYAVLGPRLPTFVKFTDADRELLADYPLNLTAEPKALENLLLLAGTSLSELRNAASAGDQGAKLQTLQDNANEKLRAAFHDAWSQARTTVFLQVHSIEPNAILRIHMKSEPGGCASISGSSDGMRSFIVLLAFVARHSQVRKPVLLIDEAESHLHYDAQADLIRVLTRQTLVEQVIYTTHSAGCLPQDLGTAIKPVKALRMALISYDNAIEVSITTYLSLHPSQRGNRKYERKSVELWLSNFYTKLDFLDQFLLDTGTPQQVTRDVRHLRGRDRHHPQGRDSSGVGRASARLGKRGRVCSVPPDRSSRRRAGRSGS
jgi:predicted ATPase